MSWEIIYLVLSTLLLSYLGWIIIGQQARIRELKRIRDKKRRMQ